MELNQLFIEKQWLIDINRKLNELPDTTGQSKHWSKTSIYRIPTAVTDMNKRAYKPQIVSIGPYHHGAEHLKAMEEHKPRALLHFLWRSNKCLQALVEALIPVVQDLRDAYDQLDSKWQKDDDKFLEMMILDGCFILEILHSALEDDRSSNDQDYAWNDPIFSYHGQQCIVMYLMRDMLMLENQIPMLVLEKLASVQNDDALKKPEELTKLILKFFSQTASDKHQIHPLFKRCLHILDVYRTSLLEEPPSKRGPKKDRQSHNFRHGRGEIIRSATELIEAGIQIEKSETRSLNDISFRKGVLKLPLVVVDDTSESGYLNLIAFERFHVGVGNEVTSYIYFMEEIIDNATDVRLLHSCGIIQNALGHDEAVANLFDLLSKDISWDPKSSLDEVCKKVNAYCQQRWHRWRANLVHGYSTNFWTIVSVVAAIILFVLTLLQTVFAVLSYAKQP